jgi:hypothetical protein
VPFGTTCDSPLTSCAVTQRAPGLGECEGDGLGDFEGEGDFDGDGLGDLDGDGLFDGEGLFDGVVVLDGLLEGVLLGVGLLDGVDVLVGLGLLEEVELLDGAGLLDELLSLEAARPESFSTLACKAAAVPDPQGVLADFTGSASAGATAGPDSRNKPAPAATAACPTRTTLTGTRVLR